MENQSQEEAAYSNQLESKMQVNMNKKEKMDKDKIQLWQREDKIQWHTYSHCIMWRSHQPEPIAI